MELVKASRVASKALDFIGCQDEPKGSKRNYFNQAFFEDDPFYKDESNTLDERYNWNIPFLWYLFNICDAANLFVDGNKTTDTDEIIEYYVNKDSKYDENPKVGDLAVTYDKKIGIVVNVLTPYSYDVVIADVDWCSTVLHKIRCNDSMFYCFLRPDYFPEEPASNEGGDDPVIFKPTDSDGIDFTVSKDEELEIPDYPLAKGDQGREVNKLRAILIHFNIKDNSNNLVAKVGKIGVSVVEAIKNFQSKYGITITGKYDEEMYNKVKELLKK